jgi:hypothetical protein
MQTRLHQSLPNNLFIYIHIYIYIIHRTQAHNYVHACIYTHIYISCRKYRCPYIYIPLKSNVCKTGHFSATLTILVSVIPRQQDTSKLRKLEYISAILIILISDILLQPRRFRVCRSGHLEIIVTIRIIYIYTYVYMYIYIYIHIYIYIYIYMYIYI